jgi:3-phenylpropionate/trans-cinnamate dioxygenase ferredoxin reductase subunit
MQNNQYKYIIVGAGLAGASAVEGIREIDKLGTILLVGSEAQLPYNRPPLSKKLWLEKEKFQDIFVHDQSYYDKNKVTLLLKTRVKAIESSNKKIICEDGHAYCYEKLLLATGRATWNILLSKFR